MEVLVAWEEIRQDPTPVSVLSGDQHTELTPCHLWEQLIRVQGTQAVLMAKHTNFRTAIRQEHLHQAHYRHPILQVTIDMAIKTHLVEALVLQGV